MEKLDLQSPDLTARNIDALAELFPTVVTEIRDTDGTIRRGIDFDLLRQEISDHVVEGPQERYSLDWPGKRKALLAANAPIRKTLRPVREESVDFDTTRNLFIEGDNLEALKLLQESYLGRVKLIYIDPPYNTGNDFIYDDDFAETTAEYLARSGQVDETGARLVANTESNGRFHSDWLSMMYPRLKLARNLLREDGGILISIDRNELAQLTVLLAQVFGPRNVVAIFAWASNLKGRQISDGGPAGTHEYVVCAGRNSEAMDQFRGSATELRTLMPTVYKGGGYDIKQDSHGPYVTKNELYNTNSKFNEKTAPTMVFRIHYNPETKEVRVSNVDDPTTYPGFHTALPHRNARTDVTWHAWRWSRTKVLAESDDLEFDTSGPELRLWTKIRDVDGMTLKDLIIGPSTVSGQKDLESLGLDRAFETPKPVALLETLIGAVTSGSDIVMDFFAGSAATADAVLRRNAADGKQRAFVLMQLPERCPPSSEAHAQGFDTIADLGRERARRAGNRLRAAGYSGDIGLRALKVDTPTTANVWRAPGDTSQDQLSMLADSVVDGRTGEDLLFHVLLDWGLELNLPIVREVVGDSELFAVDDGLLIACFAQTLTRDLVTGIAQRQPARAVFRDSAFATDADRINAQQLFAQVAPHTELRTV